MSFLPSHLIKSLVVIDFQVGKSFFSELLRHYSTDSYFQCCYPDPLYVTHVFSLETFRIFLSNDYTLDLVITTLFSSQFEVSYSQTTTCLYIAYVLISAVHPYLDSSLLYHFLTVSILLTVFDLKSIFLHDSYSLSCTCSCLTLMPYCTSILVESSPLSTVPLYLHISV